MRKAVDLVEDRLKVSGAGREQQQSRQEDAQHGPS
jgi:hypothetical protein